MGLAPIGSFAEYSSISCVDVWTRINTDPSYTITCMTNMEMVYMILIYYCRICFCFVAGKHLELDVLESNFRAIISADEASWQLQCAKTLYILGRKSAQEKIGNLSLPFFRSTEHHSLLKFTTWTGDWQDICCSKGMQRRGWPVGVIW